MKECTTCKRIWISITRFGWGTIIFFLWVTILVAWQAFRAQLWWWILPQVPWIPGLLAALLFTWSGLCILFAWMWKVAFAKVWVIFLIAAIVTLFKWWALMTVTWWWVRPLLLLWFFCFGLAVHSPRYSNLMWTSSCSTKESGCCGGTCHK